MDEEKLKKEVEKAELEETKGLEKMSWCLICQTGCAFCSASSAFVLPVAKNE